MEKIGGIILPISIPLPTGVAAIIRSVVVAIVETSLLPIWPLFVVFKSVVVFNVLFVPGALDAVTPPVVTSCVLKVPTFDSIVV